MRIVCLSAEAADICFRLGAEADVVAVSAFAPKQPQKPVVSGFSHGNIEDIVQADPELVITFSDVQARLADNLIRAGIPVLALKSFYGCRGGRRDSAVGSHPRASRSGRKPGQLIPGGFTEVDLLSGGASPNLFRGMERPNDYWYPLDFGNHSKGGRREGEWASGRKGECAVRSENLERFFLPFRHLPVRPFAISPTRPFAFPGLTALYVDRIDLPQ